MFNSSKDDHLSLICPDCNTKTKVKNEKGVECTSPDCKTSFRGMVFKRRKLLKKSSAYLIVAGAIGGIVIENSIEDTRLPYAAEYRLMDLCLNSRSGMVDVDRYSERIESCSCAIRKAVNTLGVARDRNEPDEVLEAFSYEVKVASNECR
ncbi:hypothetical protein OA92_08660 [Marinomonas sp. SBI22]|uniref:hypothetical protein n=1 Tax=unclassified Marinomonas TaxID=196814 RepID=UPI0007AFC7AA|nr:MULTISPECIES: hypothetical protein [unclassified Marinomonas]KZM43735.1 hypothetical protein OA92_08660 [Marinomonas sp. SBI22]KZM47297.1 hypothetical protein OA91_02040 [Marinomonas sp. SBI8L]